MICAEWWAFELLTVIAGRLGTHELAAQTMCLQIVAILFMISVGIQEATGALIGNSIGANNVTLAYRFFWMTLKFTVVLTLIVSALTIVLRVPITHMFTEDEELIVMVAPLMVLTGFNFLADGTAGYLNGPIRALGLQKEGSYIALVCYWLIGIPLSCVLAFKCNWGVTGLMTGLFIGIVLSVILYFILILKQDWKVIAQESIQRILKEDSKIAAAQQEQDMDS